MPRNLDKLLTFVFIYGLGSASGFVKVFLISAVLNPVDFGYYLLVILTAGFVSYFSSLGIYDAFLVMPRDGPSSENLIENYKPVCHSL